MSLLPTVMNIFQSLQKYGLSNNQAVVYISLLKKTESTVYNIAQDTDIPRTTVYEILEQLREQGLVSLTKVNGVKKYFSESPKRLLKLLEEKTLITDSILPALFALSKSDSISPEVHLYMGQSGKRQVLDDILDTCERYKQNTYLAIAGSKLPQELPKYLKDWIKRKESLKIRNLLITNDDGTHKAPKIYPSNDFRETRLSSDKINFDSTINIYHDKVAIFSEKDGVDHSIIIRSRSIADTFSKFFMFMWDHSMKC